MTTSKSNRRHPNMPFIFLLILICLALAFSFPASTALADETEEPTDGLSAFWQELQNGFDFTIRIVGSGTYKKPAESTQNPDNDFLAIRQYHLNWELRPDFNLTYRKLELMAKPRASLSWEKLDNDNRPMETWWTKDTDFIEYRMRVSLTEALFGSYGRENLQWGPTILHSPSNPFFQETGRANSQTELAGKEFARLVYVQDLAWSVSLIANVAEELYERKAGCFENIYAFKLDYNGTTGYASMILSHEETVGNTVGMFGGWNINESARVYFEGELSKENSALYPSTNRQHPMGGDLGPLKKEDKAYDGALIVGLSYTFETLIELSLEYFYNSKGYSNEEADDYFAIRRNAANAYYTGPYTGLARSTLGSTVNNGLRYLREHYLFLQISRRNIFDVLDLRCISTYNLDDTSNMTILHVGYNFNDHTEFFLNGVYNSGPADSEFTSILDYRCSIGFKYTF